MKQDIHFNHQFSSVNAWSTKGRKAGHLYAIKIEISLKNNINVLSFNKLKFWIEIGGGMTSNNLGWNIFIQLAFLSAILVAVWAGPSLFATRLVPDPKPSAEIPVSDKEGPILIQDPAYRDSFENQRSSFALLMSPPFPGSGGVGGGGRFPLTGALGFVTSIVTTKLAFAMFCSNWVHYPLLF